MAATPVARGMVRLHPAPVHDPPYDDERPAEWWPAAGGQPPLELPLFPAGGWRPEPAPRPVRPPESSSPGDSPPGRRPPGSSSPATTAAAVRFVNTCLEILNGYRPLSHVRALADPLAASAVLAELTGAARRLGPVTCQEGLLRLRAMRTCEPRPGVAEIAVAVGVPGPARGTSRVAGCGTRGGRAWALAFRLERQHGRWLCTAAQLL